MNISYLSVQDVIPTYTENKKIPNLRVNKDARKSDGIEVKSKNSTKSTANAAIPFVV
jgi:hypothetical protein